MNVTLNLFQGLSVNKLNFTLINTEHAQLWTLKQVQGYASKEKS